MKRLRRAYLIQNKTHTAFVKVIGERHLIFELYYYHSQLVRVSSPAHEIYRHITLVTHAISIIIFIHMCNRSHQDFYFAAVSWTHPTTIYLHDMSMQHQKNTRNIGSVDQLMSKK